MKNRKEGVFSNTILLYCIETDVELKQRIRIVVSNIKHEKAPKFGAFCMVEGVSNQLFELRA
jgi:hypothetical protein